MQKLKWLVTGIIIFIVPFMTVQAECSNSETVRLSSLAENVKFTPVFKEETGKFDIYVTNLPSTLYFKNLATGREYRYTGNDIVIGEATPNTSYRLKFFSASGNCPNQQIFSKYVNLPGYNPYYNDALCKGIEGYKLCQKWVNYNYSHDSFVQMVTEYREKLLKEEEPQKEKVVMGFYDYIIKYYQQYYYIILPLIIVICILLIIKKRKEDDPF